MVNHAEEMAKPGITPGGYVRGVTFETIRSHFDLIANDNTDRGRFELPDETVIVGRFVDLAEDDFYKLLVRIDEEPPIEFLLSKHSTADSLAFFLKELLVDLDAALETPTEDVDPKPVSTASEPSSSADVGTGVTDEGKSAPGDSSQKDTPEDSVSASQVTPDTTVTGDSTSEAAPVDPAETASSDNSAEEATASSETTGEAAPSVPTKKTRKKADAPAE